MSAAPTAHLNFAGDARAALDFYAAAFGGVAIVRTYAEVGMPAEVPGSDRVVWGLATGAVCFRVMAYDVPPQAGETAPVVGSTRRQDFVTITDQPFFLALEGATLAECEGYWKALSDGATVVEPLVASDWSAGFGMLTDRFGVTWTLSVAA